MDGIRYANIGIAVGVLIVVAGVLAFKDSSEAAMQLTALVGFFSALGVSNALQERARRRRRKGSQ